MLIWNIRRLDCPPREPPASGVARKAAPGVGLPGLLARLRLPPQLFMRPRSVVPGAAVIEKRSPVAKSVVTPCAAAPV